MRRRKPQRRRATHQEERVCEERVEEDAPADPAARPLAAVDNLRDGDGDDDADKLVPRVRDQVVQLGGVGDAHEVASELEDGDLEEHRHEGSRRRVPEQLGLELAPKAGHEGRQQDVRHDGHDGDVHVGAVDVVARRQVEALLAAGADGLLAGPRLVPPREQDEEELVDDVGICDVEVVLERVDVDVAVELDERASAVLKVSSEEGSAWIPYVLLHILLVVLEGRLAELGGDLGGGIVHELAVPAKDVAGGGAALLLVGAAGIALLRALLRHWRRRRSQLGDCRDMLRDGVVEGRGLPICRGALLHRGQWWWSVSRARNAVLFERQDLGGGSTVFVCCC